MLPQRSSVKPDSYVRRLLYGKCARLSPYYSTVRPILYSPSTRSPEPNYGKVPVERLIHLCAYGRDGTHARLVVEYSQFSRIKY